MAAPSVNGVGKQILKALWRLLMYAIML